MAHDQLSGNGSGAPIAYGPPTNTVAILSLVLAFVFAPAAIVLGVVARNQIARTGEGGSGLALAGLITGSVFTGLWVLYFVFVAIVFGSVFASLPAAAT